MARRMIDTGMWSNENFAALPSMGRLLLIGVITLADDQGRCKANPAYLRSQIFPYEDIATSDIDCWLDQMAHNGTVILYDVAGKAYLQLTNWWEYQPLDWARPSDYPPPSDWQDRIRYNAKGGVHLTHNWRTKSGVLTTDTCDSKGSPLVQKAQKPAESPAEVDTTVPTQVPTEVGTPTNKTNLNKTKSSPEDDAVALVKLIQAHGFVYTDQGATALATQLIERYGWDRCNEAIAKLKAAHDKQVKTGRRGIAAPLAYLRSVLEEQEATEAESNKDFEANAWQQLSNNTPDYMRQ